MNDSPLNIKALRERAKLSQHELAALIKVSQPLIVAYESGDRSPNARRLPIIAAALGVEIGDLFITDTPVESTLSSVPA